MHLADAFIQSNLQCIQDIHFLSVVIHISTKSNAQICIYAVNYLTNFDPFKILNDHPLWSVTDCWYTVYWRLFQLLVRNSVYLYINKTKIKNVFFNYLCFLLLWDTHLTRLTHIRCVHVCVCLWYKGVWVENNNSNSVRLHRGRGVILQLQTSRCESAGWLTEGMCWIFPPRKIIFQPK